MAIQSSKQEQKNTPVTPKSTSKKEDSFQSQLRPKKLTEYIGQGTLKKHLWILIESAKKRESALEHILFYGPPGLGKTTLSMIIASEMEGELKHTSGPAIEKQSDLVSILSGLNENDVLFIDEIHRIRPAIEEILYGAMEDGSIDIIVGTGTGATSIKMELPDFTLVGATTKLSKLTSPLRDRFGNICKLDFYENSELRNIVLRSGKILEIDMNSDIADAIAKRSRWTPRIANRLLKILRDYFIVGHDISSGKKVEKIFLDIGIDSYGLDTVDRKILTHIQETFHGGPVGISTIASILSEEENTIEEIIEPYLLKIGFLEKTPRGRKITSQGEKYLRNI